MRLTLTREQIPLARETVAWLRSVSGGPAADQAPDGHVGVGEGDPVIAAAKGKPTFGHLTNKYNAPTGAEERA